MKIQKSISTVLFLFVFLFASQNVFAQYYNSNEVGLTTEQIEKKQAINKEYNEKRKELRDEFHKNDTNDDEKAHEDFQSKNQKINEQEKAKLLALLSADQLEMYHAIKEEREIERLNRRVKNLTERFQKEYPDIIFSPEQVEQIAIKRKEANVYSGFDYSLVQNRDKQEKKDAIMKEVLNEQQYLRYIQTNKERKAKQEAEVLAEIDKHLPIAEELLVMADEFAIPRYKTLRGKLEKHISAKDKATIKAIRTKRIAEFEQELYEEIEKETVNFDNPQLIHRAEQVIQLVESYSDLIGILNNSIEREKVNALVKKYDAQILNVQEEMIWLNREIALKGAVIIDQIYPVPFPEQTIPKQEKISEHEKAMFLLLDTDVDFSLTEWNNITKGEGKHKASAYPSPARKNQTLEFYTPNTGNVTIDILDESGRTVRQLFSEEMNEGNQKIDVSISDLNPQVYFYRITTKEGMTMLKFVVVK